MRVAVTGGAGYIGSVVVEALIARGHAVLVIDNLSKGHRDAVIPEADFAHVNLEETPRLSRVLAGFGTDAVVHMAAPSLSAQSESDPARHHERDLAGGLSLLAAMRRARVDRVVFSSSAEVYGEPAKQPIEESDPTNPTSLYAETKLAFERALQSSAGEYGLRSISLRYFNAAGATIRNGERHEPETHLIPLVLGASAGRLAHVTVFGESHPTRDGTCVRDYIHVMDLAAAHVAALEASGAGVLSRVYNLGSGSGYSVREVLEASKRITGRPISTRVVASRPGDPPTLIVSSDRIRTDLAWSPHYQLDDILTSTWEWMMHGGEQRKLYDRTA